LTLRLSTRVRDLVVATVSSFTLPGGQVAWLCDGEIEQVEWGDLALGRPAPVTATTRFPLSSVTKAVTASLALQLVGDGELSLDGPIGDVLPDAGGALARMTLRQLLSHTSGLEDDHASGWATFASPSEYMRACAGAPPLFPPGERFSYSNGGYVVAGHLVETCQQRPWAESVRDFLLGPLDVAGTYFLTQPYAPGELADGHVRRRDGQVSRLSERTLGRAWAPAGGLALNAAGLVRLVRLHLDDGAEGPYRLLEPALVAEARRAQVEVPDPSFASAWGLGWGLFGDGWFGHDGASDGWEAHVRASAEHGFAVALLVNAVPARREWGRLLEALGTLGIDVGDATWPRPPRQSPPADPEAAGAYVNGAGRIEVAARDGRLELPVSDGAGVPLVALGHDRYLAEPGGSGVAPYLLVFQRDGEGRPRYLQTIGRIFRRADG
jgi:CubicO group peptidase (beta-lactamase class C family)